MIIEMNFDLVVKRKKPGYYSGLLFLIYIEIGLTQNEADYN